MNNNLERMRAIDDAWNNQHWADYANLLADDLISYMSGEAKPHSKKDHVARAKAFFAIFPDNKVQIEPYLELFVSADDTMTCSVARITGTMTGEMKIGDRVIAPTRRSFDTTFSVVSRWRDGKIVEERQHFDMEMMLAQLGVKI